MAYVQYGESAGSGALTVTLTGVTSGNYLVAFAAGESPSNVSVISTSAGSTGAWTSRETIVNGGDWFTGRLSTCVASATGDVTIASTDVGAWNGLMVVEIDNVDSFDSSAIARDTANPRTSGATTPASYDAMLVGFAVGWGPATPTITSGWTDVGTGMSYSGTLTGRAEYRLYSSGSGEASFGCSALAYAAHAFFIESSGGGGLTIPIAVHHMNQMRG